MKFYFNPTIDIPDIFSFFVDKRLENYLLHKISKNFVFENEGVILIEKEKDSSIINIKGDIFENWFKGDVYFDHDKMMFRTTKSGFIYRNQDFIKVFEPYFMDKRKMEFYIVLPEFNNISKYYSNNGSSCKNKGDEDRKYQDNKDNFKFYFSERFYSLNKGGKSDKKIILKELEKKFVIFFKSLYNELKKIELKNFDNSFFENILKKQFKIEKYESGFYLIASGQAPRNGRCEKIIPLIEDKILHGKFDANDRINYFEKDFLKSVKKGDTLAKILPEIKPEDGYDVFGNIIPAKYDNKPFFLSGENVERQNNLLISKIDGVVSFRRNTINVFDLYKIDGDISVYTGNIHCNSTLIVTGSIRENISVDVNGDLIVYGNIEQPNSLEVKGNLICKGGVIGNINRKYSVGSSLYAMFIENSFFEVKGNICVDKEVVRSTLYAGKNIIITYSNGVVIGSDLHFGGNLLLKYSGTSHGSGNTIYLGHSYLAERNVEFLEMEYRKYNEIIKNYEKSDNDKSRNYDISKNYNELIIKKRKNKYFRNISDTRNVNNKNSRNYKKDMNNSYININYNMHNKKDIEAYNGNVDEDNIKNINNLNNVNNVKNFNINNKDNNINNNTNKKINEEVDENINKKLNKNIEKNLNIDKNINKSINKNKSLDKNIDNIKLRRKIIYKLLKRAKNRIYNRLSKIVVLNKIYAGNKIIGKREIKNIKNEILNPIIFYNDNFKICFTKLSTKNIIKLKNELERFYKLKNFENNLNQEKVEIKDAKKEASRKDSKIVFKDKWGSFR